MTDNKEMINHPKHYTFGRIEVMEAIADWKLNFARGSVIKYTARAGKKDSTKEIEDLEKAIWYLRYEVEQIRAEQEGREARKPNDMNPYQLVMPIIEDPGEGSTDENPDNCDHEWINIPDGTQWCKHCAKEVEMR